MPAASARPASSDEVRRRPVGRALRQRLVDGVVGEVVADGEVVRLDRVDDLVGDADQRHARSRRTSSSGRAGRQV